MAEAAARRSTPDGVESTERAADDAVGERDIDLSVRSEAKPEPFRTLSEALTPKQDFDEGSDDGGREDLRDPVTGGRHFPLKNQTRGAFLQMMLKHREHLNGIDRLRFAEDLKEREDMEMWEMWEMWSVIVTRSRPASIENARRTARTARE